MINRRGCLIVVGYMLSVLSACGGGDDGVARDSAQAPDNHWRMDNLTYVAGSSSQTLVSPMDPRGGVTVAVGTPSTTRSDEVNGEYSGSVLGLQISGVDAGTYDVVPDLSTYLTKSAAGARVIVVQADVGISVTTGSVHYVATSGKVQVTKDGKGRFHFSTNAPLPMEKNLEVLGGIDGAPQTMMLSMTNVH